jgi:hypothetical protein
MSSINSLSKTPKWSFISNTRLKVPSIKDKEWELKSYDEKEKLLKDDLDHILNTIN